MKRILQFGIRVASPAASTLPPPCLLAPRRHCATTPTEDDVLLAYKTLGVHATATLADVKKRYGALAKEHHPDVSASTTSSSTTRMTDINTAYNTVKQFYSAGGRLSAHRTSAAGRTGSAAGGGGGGGPSSSSSSSYYTKYDNAYQPWYEDMDPLMYELMWEEMRRQNEEEAFAHSGGTEGFYRMGNQWRPPPPRQHQQQQGNRGNNNNNSGNSKRSNGGGNQQQQQQQGARPAAKTTTWPDEQVTAMINMYQDGKSFDFIANALGKENGAAVMAEFNRWSADNQFSKRRNNSNNSRQSNKRRRPHNRPTDFYYAESPDNIPFELYEMMEEEPYFDGAEVDGGNPFGYYTGDGDAYDPYYGTATPFYGGHTMSGGVPPSYAHTAPPFHPGGGGGNRVYNSARNASYRPARNHRGGTPQKNRRSNNNNNNGNHNSNNSSGNRNSHGSNASRSSSFKADGGSTTQSQKK